MGKELSPKVGGVLIALAVVALGVFGYFYLGKATGPGPIDPDMEKAQIEISNRQLQRYTGQEDPGRTGEAEARARTSAGEGN